MKKPPAAKWLLFGWLLALALLATLAALVVRPTTDLSQFMPRAASLQDEVLVAQLRDGLATRTLLLRIGRGSRAVGSETLAAVSRALARTLRETPLIDEVLNGTPTTAPGGTDALLFQYRYLLGPPAACSDALAAPALRSALKHRLEELVSGAALLDKQHVAADPTACYRALARQLLPKQSPERVQGVWLSPDHRHALLVVISRAAGSDIAAQRRVVEAIRHSFAALPEAKGLALELAGPGYFAVGSENRIKTETSLLSAVASGVVALVLLAAFRSPQLMLLGALPLLTGVLTGALAVELFHGQVHGITLALGVTLLGVALDYPVHVFSHMSQADAGPSPASLDIGDAGVWRNLMLGMVTTALGYAALAFTDFEGLAQLGIMAAVGLATAALSARYLLPAILPRDYRPPRRRLARRLEARLPRLPLATALVAGLALLLGGLGLLALDLRASPAPWETDIRRLSTVPQSELRRDQEIRAQLRAPDVARFLYVVAPDQASVLRALEAAERDLGHLVNRGLLGGFDIVSDWLPSPDTQMARRAALPDRDTLVASLASANAELPFDVARFSPFIEGVVASQTLPPLQAQALRHTLAGTRVALLLRPLGQRWLGLVPLSGVAEDASTIAMLRQLAQRHGLSYLDLREGTAALLSGFFSATLERLGLAAILVLMTLILFLRDPARIARVLLPIGIALVFTFVIVMRVQGAVNVFHMVSMLLVAGLAIDFGLFLSRPATQRYRTLLSVSIGAASSFAMFAMLASSAIPALKAIGFTVAVGIGLAYGSALILGMPPKSGDENPNRDHE